MAPVHPLITHILKNLFNEAVKQILLPEIHIQALS